MSSNSKIVLTNLDFDSLKQSLIQFLQGQSQFSGYNFQGAGLNVLMDLLAYNSHLMAFYLNMVANESFLDTAVLRQSVVSHAKGLGYTPRSATASQAIVNCNITRSNTDNTAILTLPRFTAFSSDNLNGTSYQFLTMNAVTASVNGNTFNFQNLQIFEGTPVSKIYQVSNIANPTQTFDLNDPNIDTSTLQIVLQQSSTNPKQSVFVPANDVTAVANNSNVYFLQEGSNGNFQIYFGDDIVGSSLPEGGLLIVSYLTTDADAANYIQNFKLLQNPLTGGNSNVTTVSASAGGSPRETIQSIQFNAPKAYVSQNRAVTVDDYIALINKNYPYFDAVNVWGGETLNPPQYGKIFISAKPKQGFAVTQAQQQYLLNNIISPISVMTVVPVYVPADYNYIIMSLDVEYDSKQTTNSPGKIAQLVQGAVNNYANVNLNSFNAEFRISRLLRACDDAEPSVLSSSAKIYIQKQFTPTLNTSQTYILTIGFPLNRGSVNNLLYSSPAFSIDDSVGVSRTAYIEEVPESFTSIENITIISPGNGYLTAPTLTISGDGTGANAYAVIVNGKVVKVVIDNPGSNYTSATIAAVGGGGSGATFNTTLLAQTGALRTYYFDNKNNKIILNANAGSIDYINGIVTLNNFAPTAIANPFGILTINVEPADSTFSSINEQILTIDPNNAQAVFVNLIDINQK